MADVVFLGLGPTSFDNKSIDRVIGQEVATGQAEVDLIGLKGPIVPRAREPQVRFNGVEAPEVEVMLEGINEFSVPPPTQNLEVDFVQVPITSGDVVGQVFNVQTPNVVLGPVGASTPVLDLPSALGEFLYPAAFDSPLPLFGLATPMAPLSLSPQTSAPVVGTALAFPPFSSGSISFPAGTLAQLNVSFPNQFPAIDGPIKGMRITFLDIPTVNPLLRGVSANMTVATYGDPLDNIILSPGLPATPGATDRFLMYGQELTRNTPVLEVILG